MLVKLPEHWRKVLETYPWKEEDEYICNALADVDSLSALKMTHIMRKYWDVYKPEDAQKEDSDAFLHTYCEKIYGFGCCEAIVKERQAFVAWLLENY